MLDKHKCLKPCCAKQRPAVVAMSEWGAGFRMRQPGVGLTSAQHEKTWLFDEEYLAVGSLNLTFNSATKCEENLLFTRERFAVEAARVHFVNLWRGGENVDMDAQRALIHDKVPRPGGVSHQPSGASTSA